VIFVTVGTHTQSFNRLLKVVDELKKINKIEEEVVMQIGYSTYEPKNTKWFRFTDYKIIEKLNKNARIIITHGGAGCILTALSFDKPIIAVPRLRKYNEHTDDHQIDLVKNLDREGKLTAVFNLNNLEKTIKKIKRRGKRKKIRKPIMNDIRAYLNQISKYI